MLKEVEDKTKGSNSNTKLEWDDDFPIQKSESVYSSCNPIWKGGIFSLYV